MKTLPNGWQFVEDRDDAPSTDGSGQGDTFVWQIQQTVDGIYFQPEHEVGLFLLADSDYTIVVCREEIHRWIVESDPGTRDENAERFITRYEDELTHSKKPPAASTIEGATFNALQHSAYRPAPSTNQSPTGTSQTAVERFFDGYIPGGTIGPLPHYGPALSCSPPIHGDGHSEAYEGVKDTKFHVVWNETHGFVIGWYCPDCDPQSLQEVERGWIPGSDDWEGIMNQSEAESENWTVTGNILMAIRPASSPGPDTPIGEVIETAELRDYFESPEKYGLWAGVPLWPGTEDYLIQCDLVRIDTPTESGGEGELVIRQPMVIDRETRVYPWNSD